MKAVAEQKTRSISCGGFAGMMLYDNESFEEKAKTLKHRNVMELAVMMSPSLMKRPAPS